MGHTHHTENTGISPQVKRKPVSHPAADALDWDEYLRVVSSLNDDCKYREALLLSVGCNLGLRISDILLLKWKDLVGEDVINITEKKTGKTRTLRINSALKQEARLCHDEMEITSDDSFVFVAYNNDGSRPITRVRAHQLLKEIQLQYDIRSAKVFSTHSLRKTFGRRVWLSESEKGRGETALVLLSETFGHSSIAITKRYLGIRQQEILSLYESIL